MLLLANFFVGFWVHSLFCLTMSCPPQTDPALLPYFLFLQDWPFLTQDLVPTTSVVIICA